MKDSDKAHAGSAQPEETSFLCFDVDRIRRGDILLTASPGALRSEAIRRVTRSNYSHAAICVAHGLFIEAVGPGVTHFAIQKFAARRRENVRVLRLHDTVDDRAQIADKAGRRADAYLALRYWPRGALLSILKTPSTEHTSSFFCSHLVAQAYREANCDLQADRNPDKVYPGAIFESELLADVTDTVLQEQTPVPYMRWDFLEASRPATPHQREVEVLQRIGDLVADQFDRHGEPRPDGFLNAIVALVTIDDDARASQLDEAIGRILESERLIDVVRSELAPQRERIDRLAKLVSAGIRDGSIDREQARFMLEFYRAHHRTLEADRAHRETECSVLATVSASRDAKTIRTMLHQAELKLELSKRTCAVVGSAIQDLAAYVAASG